MYHPILIHASPEPPLRKIYPYLHAVSFLLLSAGIAFWAIATKNQITETPGSFNVQYFGYILFIVMSLIFSSFTIMARSGARWAHVAFFLVYLPIASMFIPIIGTIICVYCFSKISKATLPALSLSYRKKRGGSRPPSKNPKMYQPVPLFKSSISGAAALSFIIVTHIFIMLMWIVDAVRD
jgi:hypothetical protein